MKKKRADILELEQFLSEKWPDFDYKLSKDISGHYRTVDLIRRPGKERKGPPPILAISQSKFYECIRHKVFPSPIAMGGITVWPKGVVHELVRRLNCGEIDVPATQASINTVKDEPAVVSNGASKQAKEARIAREAKALANSM